jgi:hypothetical protein
MVLTGWGEGKNIEFKVKIIKYLKRNACRKYFYRLIVYYIIYIKIVIVFKLTFNLVTLSSSTK